MSGSLVAKLTFILLLCMVARTCYAQSAISCVQVTSNLASCIPYLTDTGPLTPSCCGGVTSLNSAATTTADRQQVCSCLKEAASGIQNINFIVAAGLPGRCGVSIPYKISPSMDCSTIK